MTNTTKFLAGTLIATLIIGAGGNQIYDGFFGELETRQSSLRAITKQANEKKLKLHAAKLTCDKFADHMVLSLHADPAKAQVCYQEYLVKVTEMCNLSSVVVSSSQPEPVEGLGHVLHFSVQGSGRTSEIGKLIDSFYNTEALHRLSHVNVYQSLGPDAPTHSFSFDVEVLTLANAVATDAPKSIELPQIGKMQNLFASGDIFRRPIPDRITLAMTTQPERSNGGFKSFKAETTKKARAKPKPPRRFQCL